MSKVRLVMAILAGMLAGGNCWADMIKYTDKDGTMCFVDELSKVPKQFRKNIIRDDQDEPVIQTKSSRKESRQQNSSSRRVTVCVNSLALYTVNGHDLSDFLTARRYPHTVRNVMKSKDDALECAELLCRSRADLEFSSCMNEILTDVTRHMPFVAIDGKDVTGWNQPAEIMRVIDKYFNVDPNTPFVW